jgi:hypothetical protein
MRPGITHRCDGLVRRDLLRIGSLTGLGLAFRDMGRLAAQLPADLAIGDARREVAGDASRQNRKAAPAAKACILLWLDGGPSHLDMFDLKPAAPAEIRGPFRPIATTVPGLQICEHLPRTAQVAQHFALIRSLTSPLGEHGLANHYLLTGYPPSPAVSYPSFGSVAAAVRSSESPLPSYVALPEANAAAGAGYLGARYRPFVAAGDPADAAYRIADLDFFPGVDAQRIARRQRWLAQLDGFQRSVEQGIAPIADEPFAQAFRLVTSPGAKQAFDVSQEPAAIRARYGPRTFGQSCLLARRLVERGVPFVTVQQSGWDTHQDLVLRLQEGFAGARDGVGLLPVFDQAFAALLDDLRDRGLLDDTLVVAMGEFGRTPKLNTGGGRDHWPRVFSAVVAGGPVRGGQVIGASDPVGESPADRPMTPNDLARTLYTALGIDPDREFTTPDGRPVRINQGGVVVEELLG